MNYAYDGDPVGLWYEAALPGRRAFCMRDVSHQVAGAQALGLSSYTHNMLRHFAENIPRPHARKDMPHVLPDQPGNLYRTVLHHINAIARVAFLEDFLFRRKRFFQRRRPQDLQLSGAELMEQRAVFKRHHAGILGQNQLT